MPSRGNNNYYTDTENDEKTKTIPRSQNEITIKTIDDHNDLVAAVQETAGDGGGVTHTIDTV